MKKVLINFLRKISPTFKEDFLVAASGQNRFLPFYHSISDAYLPHITNLYPVRSKKLFVEDIEYFTKHFQSVDLDYITRTDKPDNPVFHISFDDGLREVYDVIAPLLLQKGIHATFFINTAFIDNKDMFFRYKGSLLIEKFKFIRNKKTVTAELNTRYGLMLSKDNFTSFIKSVRYDNKDILDKIALILEVDFMDYLKKQKPYLTYGQIKDLQMQGFTIGSHSHSHPEYRYISLQEQIEETVKSMDIITQYFAPPLKVFSFPFTCYGVKKEFFDYIYSNDIVQYSFGTSGLKDDEYARNIHRFPMDGTLIPAKVLTKAEYLYFLAKKPFNKNKIIR